MGRTGHSGRAAAVAAILLALVGAVLLLFGGRADDGPAVGDAMRAGGGTKAREPISEPGLVGRPNGETLPETSQPGEAVAAEVDRPPVPKGALRIVVSVRGRKKGQAGVSVYAGTDDEHGVGLFWFPDSGGGAWTAGSGNVGRHVRIEPEEPRGPEEGSVLVLGLDAGRYTVHASWLLGERRSHSALATVAVVAEVGATVRLDLPPTGGEGRLTVRVLRGGQPAPAQIDVRAGSMRIESLEAKGAAGAVLPVPAGVDLDVKVLSFPGSEEFELPETQRVRLEPGGAREVVFELPEGVVLTVRALGPAGGDANHSLSLWRVTGSAFPRYVGDLMRPTLPGQFAVWTGRVPVGRYTAYATNLEAEAWQTFDVRPPGPVEVSVNLRAHQGRRLRMRLSNADGTPAGRLEFGLGRDSATRLEETWHANLTTSDDGSAATPPLASGLYSVYVWNRGFQRRIQVTADMPEDLDLRLPPPLPSEGGATLRVIVRAPSGNPMNGLSLFIDLPGTPWAVGVDVNGGGEGEAKGLPPGDARVRVPYSWFRDVPYRTFEQAIRLRAGEETRLEIDLRAP